VNRLRGGGDDVDPVRKRPLRVISSTICTMTSATSGLARYRPKHSLERPHLISPVRPA
jgi:hypothetical protein